MITERILLILFYIGAESWREMAKEAIGTDSRLQVEILRSLVNANDASEALYFAQMYNVSPEEWPWHLVNYVNDNPNGNILLIFL